MAKGSMELRTETVAQLESRHGIARANELLELLTPESHPLHHELEWDNDKWGEAGRLEQCRAMIRSVRMVIREENLPPRSVPVYTRDPRQKEHGGGYVNLRKVVGDHQHSREILDELLNQLIPQIRNAADKAAVLGMHDEWQGMLQIALDIRSKTRQQNRSEGLPPKRRGRGRGDQRPAA